jgi:hypothetical protein
MTWVVGLAVLWLLVSCVAGLAIGYGLRVAEQTGMRRRTDGRPPPYDHEVISPRRLAG